MITLFLLSFIYSVDIGLLINPNGIEELGPECEVSYPNSKIIKDYYNFRNLKAIDGIYVPENNKSDSTNVQR